MNQIDDLTKAELEANSAALQRDPEILSRLEEMISDRIGTDVRHARSESVSKARPVPRRSILYRRAYTKHWFKVSGAMDDRLRNRLHDGQQLAVFVKSSSDLRIRPQLELMLSEHSGQGFRTPYYFGMLMVSGLQIAAWESLELTRCYFWRYSFEDQKRVIEAIAGINSLNASGTAPELIKWINVKPAWFLSRYAEIEPIVKNTWDNLYAATSEVMSQQPRLVAKVRSSPRQFLTHNDITLAASNISVPTQGDVIIYDWEGSTLSVPGADLGLLCELDSAERLMCVYVERMSDFGFSLDVDQVRSTAEIVRGFRALQFGWREMKSKQVELGLRLLNRHMN